MYGPVVRHVDMNCIIFAMLHEDGRDVFGDDMESLTDTGESEGHSDGDEIDPSEPTDDPIMSISNMFISKSSPNEACRLSKDSATEWVWIDNCLYWNGDVKCSRLDTELYKGNGLSCPGDDKV